MCLRNKQITYGFGVPTFPEFQQAMFLSEFSSMFYTYILILLKQERFGALADINLLFQGC